MDSQKADQRSQMALKAGRPSACIVAESGWGYAAHFRQWAGDGGCLSAIIPVQGAIRVVGIAIRWLP